MRLSGRKVLVVGVGPGLGSATVYLLLKEGAEVVMAARSEERLKEAKESMKRYGKIDYVVGDASTLKGAKAIVDAAAKKAGRIDHLALLSGSFTMSPMEKISEEQMKEMVEGNMNSPIYVLAGALDRLGSGSSVVMVSSVLGTYSAGSGTVAYSMTKAAVAKAVELLAKELSSKGIRVNGVAPNHMNHDFAPERDWRSMRRLGGSDCPPEDVASVVVWLLTDEASWVSGAVIPVDGGARGK